jgi:hypothetical protein
MAEAAPARPWRRWDYWAAFGAMLVLGALFQHDWDGYVFETAVRQLWQGETPYEVAERDPPFAYLGPTDRHAQWYAYPPLPLLAMAASFLPAILLDLPEPAQRVLLKLPVMLATLALAGVAAAWSRRLGASAEDAVRIERRFLFNPFLLLVGGAWGMTDTALMAVYMGGLLAYANGKPGRAGVLVALATLIKPFPALLLLPILPYLIAQHGWAPLRRAAAAGTLTAIPILAPFVLTAPHGFWQQAVGMHLARAPQGVTPWTLWPLDLLSAKAITVASLVLMCASLLAVGWSATRLRGRGTTLLLTLLASISVLVWNRVLNEQYLVMVVAPLLVLDLAHQLDRFGHFLTRWTPAFFAAMIVAGGFHFLTFIPPDIALPLFGQSVDAVAEDLRTAAPGFWKSLQNVIETGVILTLLALGALAARIVSQRLRATRRERVRHHFAPIATAGGLVLMVAIFPALAAPAGHTASEFTPAYPEPRVAAFHYLWWNNPAHDPGVRYGNWDVVSQVPADGYYTSTRGVARQQARQMVAAGIDTAIVSYHRGELDRYRTFQEEAQAAGLRVAPLIELNQVYDQPWHHPKDHEGRVQPFAAYRLDNATRKAIEQFTLDLKAQLALPSTLRLDGRPTVFYYDSYPSTVGYDQEDKESLARVLLGLFDLGTLRAAFKDPGLEPTVADVLRHYPSQYKEFFHEGAPALWRTAHLEEHRRFWVQLRQDLEAQLGPLTLISGEGFNERAGFEAGTDKGVVDLELFDGAFIYSPSFTWGGDPDGPVDAVFRRWEDRNRWLVAFAEGAGKISSFGIAPAYDDTVNRPHGFRIPPSLGNASFYDASWASTVAHPPSLAAVATWNEYFEGSSIEPSREYGDQYLAATLGWRRMLEAQPGPQGRALAVVHELESRTHPAYSEMDTPHALGLRLVATLFRSGLDAKVAAVDGRASVVAPATPTLVLADGGRADYRMSATVVQRMQAWRDAGIPTLLFGPELAPDLQGLLPASCRGALSPVEGVATLAVGDRLRAEPGRLVLVRDGTPYQVGTRCADSAVAWSAFKPWHAEEGGDSLCLQVALRALAPEAAPEGAPAACEVTSREPLEDLQDALVPGHGVGGAGGGPDPGPVGVVPPVGGQ